MKRKNIIPAFVAACVLFLSPLCLAEEALPEQRVFDDANLFRPAQSEQEEALPEQRVFDDANLFRPAQSEQLEASLSQLRADDRGDFAIVTTADAQGKSAMAYADDFYDEHGFGSGTEKGGALLLIDMDNREIYISTSGAMIGNLTNREIELILDGAYPYLGKQQYSEAANAFLVGVRLYGKPPASSPSKPPNRAAPKTEEAPPTPAPVKIPKPRNPRMFDDQVVFGIKSREKLAAKIERLCSKGVIDYAVVSYSIKDMSMQEFGQAYYEANGLGSGDGKDCAMLLIHKFDKKAVVLYFGSLAERVDPQAVATLEAEFLARFNKGDDLYAVNYLLDKLDNPAAKFSPYQSAADFAENYTGYFFLFLFVSLGAGAASCFFVARRYNMKTPAYSYPFRQKATLSLSVSDDDFINETTTKRYIPPPSKPDNTPSSRGGSGSSWGGSGSSRGGSGSTRSYSSGSHRSSSGRSHGGGGRKF